MSRGATYPILVALLAACQSGAPIGTTCSRDSECSSPLVCRLGRCRDECSANRDCPTGARCLLAGGAGSCSLEVDQRCQSGGHVCPVSLTCLGDECVNTCMTPSDCPPDALCSPAVGTMVSFCFAVGREDGGLGDAGSEADAAIDAGQIDAGIDAGPRDADVPDAGPCSGSGCDEAIDLCVGDGFACAVRADHHVRCWGRDDQGQIGDGTDATHPHAYPTCISGLRCATPGTVLDEAGATLLATRVACGESGACAVTTDAHVACWGSNDSGQAGLRAQTGIIARAQNVTALPSAALQHPVEVRAMRNVMCATMSDATIWCWGYDNDDVLQIGMGDMVTLPVRTPAWDGVTLALGMGHICGLGADATVVCRGNHLVGELGPDYLSSVPPATGSVIRFTGATHPPSAVVAGQHFSCALVEGDAWCWGSNDTYSIGRAPTWTCGASPCQLDPQPVTLSGVDHLWAEGFDDLVCAQAGGMTWCWGVTDAGGCYFAGGSCASPIHVPTLDGARQIEGGVRGLCAIDGTGGVICFGDDASGELGDGTAGGSATASDAPASVCIGAACW